MAFLEEDKKKKHWDRNFLFTLFSLSLSSLLLPNEFVSCLPLEWKNRKDLLDQTNKERDIGGCQIPQYR